jgi:hypothetical protein
MILRCSAILVGLALLGATAHVTVSSTGGYGSTHAVLTLAIAAGVGIGSLAIGRAWSDRRVALSLGIALALLCGEAFGLIGTAERLIAQREAAQAPARTNDGKRTKAAERMNAAETAIAAVPTGSARLTAALTAKTAADRAASDKATDRGCLVNCRQLLEQQVIAAASEVTAARGELAALKHEASTELATARLALTGIAEPVSGTPLADRLGLAPWILDLITATFGSIAANGLGGLLLAFSAHRPARVVSEATIAAAPARVVLAPIPTMKDVTPPAHPAELITASVPALAGALPNVIDHVDQFAVAAIAAKPRGRASLGDVHAAYLAWCKAEGIAPVAAGDFAEAIGSLVKAAGIKVTMAKRGPVLIGVSIAPAAVFSLNHTQAETV